MGITLGIRGKTVLLVMILVAAAVYFTPHQLIKNAKETVERHELTDLADEADLRAWEVRDKVAILRQVTEESKDPKRRNEILNKLKTDKVWANYLHAELIDGQNRTVLHSRDDYRPAAWDGMLQELRSGTPGKVNVTEIIRSNIAKPGAAKPHWTPLICAGTQVNESEAYIMFMIDLQTPSTSRHLIFIVDEEDTFLNHPNRSSKAEFKHKADFIKSLSLFEDFSTIKRNLSVKRVDTMAEFEISPGYWIREGNVQDGLIEELNKEDKEKQAKVINILTDRFAPTQGGAGGLTRQTKLVRVLAASKDDLPEYMDFADKTLANLHPTLHKGIDWSPPVKCTTCDVTLVLIDLETVTGKKTYRLMFTGFRDELVSNLNRELSHLWSSAITLSLLAGAIAFVVALLFIRPLRKITETALAVTATSDEGLQEKVDTISRSLPVARSDEVGDIARALRRLFTEVQASTRQLDQRVRERTSELERAMVKLRDVNREKDSFLANVSHELRNPLGVVDGYLQFLEDSDLNEEQLDDVHKSRKAAKELLELINDILDYQKITMHGITLEPEDIKLQDFVKEIRDSMQIHAERNHNKLEFKSTGNLGRIKNDAKRLRQVILNLMGNSCKFTQNGTVTLDTRRVSTPEKNVIEFRVQDTGRGMSAEEQTKIFTVFYTNKKADESGTGLGLVISRELCHLMGGSITLESSESGKGTTFLITIPIDISKPQHTALLEKPEDSQMVLVIDDDDDVRDVIKLYLTKQGYQVSEARNGKEGIELARKLRPDAITLDAVMPEIDGWDVLSTLKSDKETANIPVVMITMLNKEAKGFALGADDYLIKPIDWDRFSHVLERLTDQKKIRTILVVDDDESARQLFRRALSKEECEVIEAANGAEALKKLETVRPDIIVLDLMMPVMDGFEFLAERNHNEDWRSIPIVVVTAKSPTAREREILEHSVARVLQKGIGTTEELFATVHRHVDSKLRSATPPADK